MSRSLIARPAMQSAGLGLLCVAVILLAAARAQAPQQERAPQPLTPREKAIEAVRIINTAEYNFRKDHNRFGSWNEVYASGAVAALEHTWPNMEELSFSWNSEVIPGFRLTLLVAQDGDAYSLSLHEMQGHGCGISVFSDQSGLIYEGTVIDCPQITDHPEPPIR
jgi:hypothetical protein